MKLSYSQNDGERRRAAPDGGRDERVRAAAARAHRGEPLARRRPRAAVRRRGGARGGAIAGAARAIAEATAPWAPLCASFVLTLTTVARLNLWGLLYLIAIGHVALRVGYRRDKSAEASAAAWGRVGALVASAIVAQYSAALSMPPSVWPDPRRPWAMWADWCAPVGR